MAKRALPVSVTSAFTPVSEAQRRLRPQKRPAFTVSPKRQSARWSRGCNCGSPKTRRWVWRVVYGLAEPEEEPGLLSQPAAHADVQDVQPGIPGRGAAAAAYTDEPRRTRRQRWHGQRRRELDLQSARRAAEPQQRIYDPGLAWDRHVRAGVPVPEERHERSRGGEGGEKQASLPRTGRHRGQDRPHGTLHPSVRPAAPSRNRSADVGVLLARS